MTRSSQAATTNNIFSDCREPIYIGSMSGTSADKNVDFTAATFDTDGLPTAWQNTTVELPNTLQDQLYQLSTTPTKKISLQQRNETETKFSDFLIDAYQQVLATLELTNHPKEQIVFSPHGQTIDHQPQKFHTDQLLQGERLAKATGHPVVFRHRHACLTVSTAAPLAPVLIQQLFPAKDYNSILINGGGIANICVISADNPNDITAFDSGPANGPIDEWVRYIINTNQQEIPADLRETILQHKFDYNGEWAKRGNIDRILFDKLLAHPYFQLPNAQKSADRAQFNLAWLTAAITNTSPTDTLTTLTHVVAESIASAILQSLTTTDILRPSMVRLYGGMRNNQLISELLKYKLNAAGKFSWYNWEDSQLNPDFFESLLMAYLGFCVHNQRPIDLKYCQRANVLSPKVIPGILV